MHTSDNGKLSVEQDYTTGGDVIYNPSGHYFSVKWDMTSSEDFIVGSDGPPVVLPHEETQPIPPFVRLMACSIVQPYYLLR